MGITCQINKLNLELVSLSNIWILKRVNKKPSFTSPFEEAIWPMDKWLNNRMNKIK